MGVQILKIPRKTLEIIIIKYQYKFTIPVGHSGGAVVKLIPLLENDFFGITMGMQILKIAEQI